MLTRSTLKFVAGTALVVVFAGCQDELADSGELVGPAGDQVQAVGGSALAATSSDPAEQLRAIMDGTNSALAEEGTDYRVVKAEYITWSISGEVGNEVLAKDVGNKQLDSHFVPGDARRPWSGPGQNSITYAIDQTGDAIPPFGGLSAAQTDAAIVRAMDSWDDVSCSSLGLARAPDFGIDIGVVAFQFGFGGSPFVFADVQHAGWRDLDFAGGIIGATFTFMFCDPCMPTQVFTDVNGDGKFDTAFTEIYYDPSFPYADDGVSDVDVESIALHETGHGLSQGHFGKVFIKNNGDLKRSPFAVMNALYSEPVTELVGTDNGGHCSIWGNWPTG